MPARVLLLTNNLLVHIWIKIFTSAFHYRFLFFFKRKISLDQQIRTFRVTVSWEKTFNEFTNEWSHHFRRCCKCLGPFKKIEDRFKKSFHEIKILIKGKTVPARCVIFGVEEARSFYVATHHRRCRVNAMRSVSTMTIHTGHWK